MRTVKGTFNIFNPNQTHDYEYYEYESFAELVKELGEKTVLDLVNASLKRHSREEERKKVIDLIRRHP